MKVENQKIFGETVQLDLVNKVSNDDRMFSWGICELRKVEIIVKIGFYKKLNDFNKFNVLGTSLTSFS